MFLSWKASTCRTKRLLQLQPSQRRRFQVHVAAGRVVLLDPGALLRMAQTLGLLVLLADRLWTRRQISWTACWS